MKHLSFLPFVFCLFLFSCNPFGTFVTGNGKVISETRSISSIYDSISTEGVGTVIIKNGSPSVVVSTDSNIQEYIETFVEGSTLRIKSRDFTNFVSFSDLTVTVTMPSLVSIKNSGTAELSADSFTSSTFQVNLSGTGKITAAALSTNLKLTNSGTGTITMTGSTININIIHSGTGVVNAGLCPAVNANVTLSGTGDILVSASSYISGYLSGIGSISCYGSPTTKSITRTGIGSVIYY